MAVATAQELSRWNELLLHGDLRQQAEAAEWLATAKDDIDEEFVFTVCDKFWNRGQPYGDDLMEGSGTDPRNNVPTAKLKAKGSSELISQLMDCSKTMVGVIVETAGLKMPFYVDTHLYDYAADGKPAWTSNVDLKGIWDILNYYQIWPSWYLPIQAQPFSHAVFIAPLCTLIENMISECALRIQSGIWEFVNNALSLNPDIRAWFGTLLQSNGNIFQMLKTPTYVVRTNPFLDGSPLYAKTVRMQSCGAVIQEITAPYGVDVDVSLWEPGDPQPDAWANLTQPTYVVTVKDRSQIEGPTKTVLDSVLRSVVDLGGSLGDIFEPIIQGVPGMDGQFYAPLLGINFVAPYAMLEVPEHGGDGPVMSCKVFDHTPKGWQHVIGGRSPKWLNDMLNALFAYLIDMAMIAVGFTGLPSNLLDGFLNNAFLAFQLIEHYGRRNDVGPYHPAIERFTPTESAPYNIEAVFQFINLLWESRGYTSAMATCRNGAGGLQLGRDIFRGGLMSIIYPVPGVGKRMFTDYIEMIMWKVSPTERTVTFQVGDGKADEPPLGKFQRFITGIQEAINVWTLAPQS